MSLIVETGTAASDAESLCSVAAADAYHSARGNSAWAALATDAKEQALRRATDYIGQVYGNRWMGIRMTETQALDWPRWNVKTRIGTYYASTVVPTEVVRACADLALRASSATLLTDGSDAAVIREKVGPIEVEYAAGGTAAITFKAIDGMLAHLLSGNASAMGGGFAMIGIRRA